MAIEEHDAAAGSGGDSDAGDDTSTSTDSSVAPARVTLASTSRSADAGHLSAADVVSIARDAAIDFRLVGGNAISLLVWTHDASDLVPGRETNDADLGAPSGAAGAASLVGALISNGYRQTQGNRFTRTVHHDGATLDLEIDVLIPSYSDHLRTNQPFGELVVDAIPGLSTAIARQPTRVEVTARLTTGDEVIYTVALPEPISALCMKAYSYRWRLAQRDAFDIWRLLEVAFKLGLTQSDWPKGATGRATAEILHTHFGSPASRGPAVATDATAIQARIRALVLSVVPRPPT